MSSRPEQDAAELVQPRSLEEIAGSPLWHLYEYDLAHHTFTLMQIAETLYREASFLDSRVLDHGCPSVRYELQHIGDMFRPLDHDSGPLGFIFHVGHCGSTLLSRALAASPSVLPFREPITLRSLSIDLRELDTPMAFMSGTQWNELLAVVLSSLSRRFRDGQLNVIKATSTGNNLIRPVLERDERHRALLLYIPLEAYLATMLGKKKEGGDLWSQARTRMTDWLEIDPRPGFSLHELKAHHFAVLSWLTSMHFMLEARARFGDRVALLDFEKLLADPDEGLAGVARFFGLDAEAHAIVEQFPDIASSYSKRPDKRYSPEIRAQLLQHTRDGYGEDIASGLDWARTLIARAPSLEPLGEHVA